MATYRHLLLATSLTQDDDSLAIKAVQLAEDFSARLSLLHVLETEGRHGIATARDLLNDLGRRLVIPGFDQRIVVGSVPMAISKVAQTLKVDAVIVGYKSPSSSKVDLVDSFPCDVIQVRI